MFGASGIFASPSTPWQTAQTDSAFARPPFVSPCASAPSRGAQERAKQTPRATVLADGLRRNRIRPPRDPKKKEQLPRRREPPFLFELFLLAVVPDAVDGADEIVGYEERSIPILLDVDRAAEIVAVVVPAFGERDRRPGHMAVIFQEGDHDPRADRHGAVPRAVLGREDRILVFRREHVARVE